MLLPFVVSSFVVLGCDDVLLFSLLVVGFSIGTGCDVRFSSLLFTSDSVFLLVSSVEFGFDETLSVSSFEFDEALSVSS